MNNISPTLKSKLIVEQRKKMGLPIYDGGLGENHQHAHYLLIKTAIENIEKKSYTNIEGENEFKTKVKKLYKTSVYTPTYSLVGNGLKELIYLLISAWKKKVILITPCWVTYLEDVKILNKKYELFETEIESNFKINFDKLDKCLSSNQNSLLFINNPNNPTGVVYSKEDIKKIAVICEKYNITIFEDSIYYHMSQVPIERISKYYDKVITGSSLSKDWASGGWRFGWMVFSEKLKELFLEMKRIGSCMYSCPTHFMNDVGCTAIDLLEDEPEYFNKMRLFYLGLHVKIAKVLSSSKLICSKTEGSWYTWIDFRNYKNKLLSIDVNNSNELMMKLIDDLGLVTVPASAFGSDKLALRVSLVDHKIIEGIRLLIKWLSN